MKKIITSILAGALVSVAGYAQSATPATSAAPAPSIKISGGVETGLYYSTDKVGDQGTLRLQDFDDTGYGTRAYIGALYDAGLYGFKATLRIDYDPYYTVPASSNVPYLSEGYAWVAPFDGQLNFKLGAVTESSLSTGGDIGFLQFNDTYYTGAYCGASLVFAPKDTGLTIGALLPVDVNAVAGNAARVLSGTTVAVKYTLATVFDAVVGYTLADTNNTGFNETSTVYGPLNSNGYFGSQAIAYGFDLLAIPALSLNAEGYIPFNSGKQITLDEKVGITPDKFSMYVIAYQFVNNGAGTPPTYASFKPYFGYALDDGITPGIYLYYNTANSGSWSVDPNVKFALGSATFVVGFSVGTNITRDDTAALYQTDAIGANLYTDFEFLF